MIALESCETLAPNSIKFASYWIDLL